MDKFDLIKLHAELSKIKTQLERRPGIYKEFEAYDKLSVTPLHFHKSKNEHEEAVKILCKSILLGMEK